LDLSPKFRSGKFQCPHCHVAAQQQWFDVGSVCDVANDISNHVYYDYRKNIQDYQQKAIEGFLFNLKQANIQHMRKFIPAYFAVATCSACGQISVWIGEEIVYPKKTVIASPNVDMDQDIQDLYLEASAIVVDSPKGATALLRLALQLLLKQLGKSGNNINNDIKELVANGLSPKIQQALDLLRVVGNNAVHPGQIDLEDGRDIALKLFHVLNFIADEMISKPKELDLLYSNIVPEETKRHIKERDKK